MEKSKTYGDLIVWQKAHNLVLDVYKINKEFPKEEVYGLTSQFRRAAISIPANIAEGFARKGSRDKLRFYNIAAGSLNEISYYILLARDLNYTTTDLREKVEEVGKILKRYTQRMRDQNNYL
ncbi:MAG: four helix bundle protein [Bacteroidales bacterium]|nr:four helix bundle protein [Bacteroidales bacterium]